MILKGTFFFFIKIQWFVNINDIKILYNLYCCKMD